MRFPKLGLDAPGTLSISGGLATFPWDGTDALSLLRHADQLALQSKREGKNLITFGPRVERRSDPEAQRHEGT
jgi:GGDEF domain-containing protein